jgi:hypothetical protein
MKKYRNSQQVDAAKIVEVSGILQSGSGTTCVLRFDDGTSSQVDFQWFIQANGAVGSYLVNFSNGTTSVMSANDFEKMYSKL